MIACQARHITTQDEHIEFVEDFLRPIRAEVAYQSALLVITVENNNNQTVASMICDACIPFAPLYFTRRIDVQNPKGDITLTAEDEKMHTIITKGAGIMTGLDIMEKQWYVAQFLLVLGENRFMRAKKLKGFMAEEAWSLFLEECKYLATLTDKSAKKPDFVQEKMAISGKSGAMKSDDTFFACAINLCVMYANVKWEGSRMHQFVKKEGYVFCTR
jgi:hypothetical protein